MRTWAVRRAAPEDLAAWRRLDKHIDPAVLARKLAAGEGYLLEEDGAPCGVLRYFLFWDSVPFCSMLFLGEKDRFQGGGTLLMDTWERDMKARGFGMVMTSTQADEEAQHFYRKLGYRDAGGFVVNVSGYEQPLELILTKEL